MTELPRKAAARTARLAALPLGYAGRQAMGFGKRLGGKPADAVLTEVQQRTAEQLFRTLGELKGGAMKFGQALSVLEAALPEEVAAPYREHLTALQDSAPRCRRPTVRQQLTHPPRRRLARAAGLARRRPTAAASIGQVHRGRWLDHTDGGGERDVAVKVQYPGAGEALMSDLRQIARVARGIAPVFPGLDIKPLVAELQARAADELDYHLEAEAQAAYAEAFADHPDIVVPAVVAVGGEVLVTEWMDSPHSLAHIIREGTQEERDHYGELFVRFLFEGPRRTGMLHADPHPGNFRILPGPTAASAGSACSTSAPSPGCEGGACPTAMGRLMRIALDSDEESLVAGLREEGFIKDRITVDPALVLTYLAPFVEPAAQETFTFTREWMREQFERINDPRSETFTLATRSTSRRRTSSSTAPGSAASACSASSARPRRSARSSRSRCRASPRTEAPPVPR